MGKREGGSRWNLRKKLRCEVRKIFEEMHEYYKKNYTPKVKPTKALFVLFAKRNLYAKAGKGRFC